MTTDAALAARLADLAGQALLQVRATQAHLASRQLKDAGDATAQAVLAAALAEHRPGDAVLSEEARDDHARLDSARVWIIDPLDGTREFSEIPRDDWAVHVALWAAGDLSDGAVALPARAVTYRSDRPASLPPRTGPIRLAVSRSRAPDLVSALARSLDAELVAMGSAGVKAMAVLQGTADAYVHAGGQFEWDSAAPVAVARAHGLVTTRLDGSPLRYNQPDPYLPDLVIARPEVHDTLRQALDRL